MSEGGALQAGWSPGLQDIDLASVALDADAKARQIAVPVEGIPAGGRQGGDASGGVNSAIDEIVGQADDVFRMPYCDIASSEPRYNSTFVVAINGRFTSNAKEKIVSKVSRGVRGSLLILDQESIFELVDCYWKYG